MLLRAELACRAGIASQRVIKANLAAGPMGVDLGAISGLQFPPSSTGSLVSLSVRAMPRPGDYLRSILLKITTSSAALDSSDVSWTPASPVRFAVTAKAGDIPGEPRTLALISGANVPSEASSRRGEVELGTLHVRAREAGLALLSGEILSIESVSTIDCDILAQPTPSCYSSATFEPIVAGTGYVEIAGRRLLHARGGSEAAPSGAASLPAATSPRGRRRRALSQRSSSLTNWPSPAHG